MVLLLGRRSFKMLSTCYLKSFACYLNERPHFVLHIIFIIISLSFGCCPDIHRFLLLSHLLHFSGAFRLFWRPSKLARRFDFMALIKCCAALSGISAAENSFSLAFSFYSFFVVGPHERAPQRANTGIWSSYKIFTQVSNWVWFIQISAGDLSGIEELS